MNNRAMLIENVRYLQKSQMNCCVWTMKTLEGIDIMCIVKKCVSDSGKTKDSQEYATSTSDPVKWYAGSGQSRRGRVRKTFGCHGNRKNEKQWWIIETIYKCNTIIEKINLHIML